MCARREFQIISEHSIALKTQQRFNERRSSEEERKTSKNFDRIRLKASIAGMLSRPSLRFKYNIGVVNTELVQSSGLCEFHKIGAKMLLN